MYPIGNYADWDSTKTLTGVKFAPGISGVNLAVKWKDVQTSVGFDWNAVDLRMDEAALAKLNVALILSDSPQKAPGFLVSGSQKISLSGVTAPVFWDPAYHAGRLAFIQAAGERYASNPSVVAVNCSCMNWDTDDWSVPHSNGQDQQWLTAGWTTAQSLGIAQAIIDTTAAAFPTQCLKLAIGTTSSSMDGSACELATEILAYAYATYPDRFYAQINSLSDSSPVNKGSNGNDPDKHAYLYYLLGEHPGFVGLQMLSAAKNLGSGSAMKNLQNAVNIALTYKPVFCETWSGDAQSQAFGPIFLNAAAAMQAN